MCAYSVRASRVGAARVGVPTYARNRAGRRDLGRRQVNTPLTYAFFPLVPFALTLVLYNSFSLSRSLLLFPTLFFSLPLPLLCSLALGTRVSEFISATDFFVHATGAPTREGSIVVTVGNPREAFLPFPSPLIPFYLSSSVSIFPVLYRFRGCARTCVCRCVLQTSRRIYLRLISLSPSILLLPHPSHLLAPST